MNLELKKALDQLESLPEEQQNQIARDLLEEIEWEKENYKIDTDSKLDNLISKAKDEHKKGKTHNIGFDDL